MSNADIGYGVTYEIEDAPGSGIFVELAEVYNVDLPELQVDEVEVTHMQSPNRNREYIFGLKDPGEASVEMNWNEGSATDTLLQGLKASNATHAHRITMPGGQVWTFSAWVKSYKPTAPIGDKMTATVGVRVTGSISIT